MVKQCHYSQQFFVKTESAMQKPMSVCGAKEGISFAFDNCNFKYLADLSFSVYCDFETTASDIAKVISKMNMCLFLIWPLLVN